MRRLHGEHGQGNGQPERPSVNAPNVENRQAKEAGDQIATNDVLVFDKRAIRERENQNKGGAKWCNQQRGGSSVSNELKQRNSEKRSDCSNSITTMNLHE